MNKTLLFKRILLYIASVFLPWLVLLIYDNPAGAILALVMQATIIGWPFATIWAINQIHPKKKV